MVYRFNQARNHLADQVQIVLHSWVFADLNNSFPDSKLQMHYTLVHGANGENGEWIIVGGVFYGNFRFSIFVVCRKKTPRKREGVPSGAKGLKISF